MQFAIYKEDGSIDFDAMNRIDEALMKIIDGAQHGIKEILNDGLSDYLREVLPKSNA